jgi:uncharacterized protein YndB with AHSA1/START domain
MRVLSFTTEIQAPLDRVFVFFVPQRMTLWYGPEMDTEFEVQGGEADFRVGQKVRITGHLGGREVSLTAVVTRYDWMRALEWRFSDAYGVRGRQLWLLEQTESVTRVQMREEYEVTGRLSRLLEGMVMKPAVNRRDRRMLKNLKRLAERR